MGDIGRAKLGMPDRVLGAVEDLGRLVAGLKAISRNGPATPIYLRHGKLYH